MKKGALDYMTMPKEVERAREHFTQHLARIVSSRDVRQVDRFIRFKRVRLEIPSDFSLLPHVAQRITNDVLAAGAIEHRQAYLLNLALYEILTNALEHGNLDITYDEKSRYIRDGLFQELVIERSARPELASRKIRVNYSISANGSTIEIADEGRGFNVREYEDRIRHRDRDSYHGRGIILARNLVDEVVFRGRGNIVRLTMCTPRTAPADGAGAEGERD